MLQAGDEVGSGDAEGAVLSFGGEPLARIVKKDTSQLGSGKVRYVLENVSGQNQEDLVWSVSFSLPPGKMTSEIQMREQVETTSERYIVLFKNDKEKALEAECPNFDPSRPIRGTQLRLGIDAPAMTFARGSDGTSGTRFYGGRVECVGISGEDGLYNDPPALWIEFENVSDRKVSDLELQVVFTDTNGRTKWKGLPSMAPGARTRVDVDLAGVDMGGRAFLVKVRQKAL
jgi:hypothetical protein